MSLVKPSLYLAGLLKRHPRICQVKSGLYIMVNNSKYVQKFKELYEQKEGKVLTDQDAFECLEKLATLVEAVYKPFSKKFLDDGSCPHCKQSIHFTEFKDKLSLREFTISGLCQNCQDKAFK